MTLDEPSPTPEPVIPPSRIRRRRRTELTVPRDAEGRTALLHSLSHRAHPSYELFVFSILCGALLGLGYFIDSQAVLIFGILLAPLLSPWIGLLLSALTGSPRFFFETFAALFIGSALIFLSGLLAGFAVRVVLPRTLNEAFLHSHLWWPDLMVLAVAAVILTVSFVHSEDKPYLPSVMLAYELFLPLSAGGFGLGSGVAGIWPNGLLVFLVYFAWASIFGLLTLLAMRFLPVNLNGFVLSAGGLLVSVLLVLLLMTGGKWTIPMMPYAANVPTPVPTLPAETATLLPLPTATSSPAPSPTSSTPVLVISTIGQATASPTMTVSPEAATATIGDAGMATATVGAALTHVASAQLTAGPATTTLTVEPTPVYARINASQANGANLRQVPNGKFIVELDNGAIVEVQSDTQDVNGVVWAHVTAIRNNQRYDGWLLQTVLEIATPVPIWNASATPATTVTAGTPAPTPSAANTPTVTSTSKP